MTRTLLLLLTSYSLAACAGGALPQAQSADAQAEIKAAETVRAADDPKAALHLKLAKDEFEQADRQAKNGDEDEAKLTLARSTADAQLAVALSKNLEAQQQANVALAKLKELDASNSPKGVTQ